MAWNEVTITLVNLTEQTGGKPFSPISVWPVIIPVPPKSFFTGYLLCPLSTKAQRRKSSVHKRLLCRKCPESLMEVICSGDNVFFFYQDFLSFDIDKSHDRRRRAPLYHLDLLHKHLHTSRAITADYSPLHLARDWTGTKVFWFPSANH